MGFLIRADARFASELIVSNSRPAVSGTMKRTKISVRTQNAAYMRNVILLPVALISERKVMETRKLDAPEPSDAAATPRPRTRSGKTSDTSIHAIGPMLNAKQVM